MVLSAVITHPPSAAFKIIVLIWKDWLVAGAGGEYIPAENWQYPSMLEGIKIASDEG